MEWQDQFKPIILIRGSELCDKGAVDVIKESPDEIVAKVQGTNLYDVTIKLKNDSITEMECSCPYQGNCKHMAATLFDVYGGEAPSECKINKKSQPEIEQIKPKHIEDIQTEIVLDIDTVKDIYIDKDLDIPKTISEFTIDSYEIPEFYKKLNTIDVDSYYFDVTGGDDYRKSGADLYTQTIELGGITYEFQQGDSSMDDKVLYDVDSRVIYPTDDPNDFRMNPASDVRPLSKDELKRRIAFFNTLMMSFANEERLQQLLDDMTESDKKAINEGGLTIASLWYVGENEYYRGAETEYIVIRAFEKDWVLFTFEQREFTSDIFNDYISQNYIKYGIDKYMK